MQEGNFQQFRQSLTKIDHLYHLKEFKNISSTKINHLKNQKKFHPTDYLLQLKRMLLHTIYLYYVGYVKKVDFYIYEPICVDKWGIIFRYYSLQSEGKSFMKKIVSQNFRQNIMNQFKIIWNMHAEEVAESEDQEIESNQKKQQQPNPWQQFGTFVVNLPQLKDSPQQLIFKLQETKFMRNNVLILEILGSTLCTCIRMNENVSRAFKVSYSDEQSIIKKIFSGNNQSEGTKDFVNSIIRFLKILNDQKILGITSTLSDKFVPRLDEEETLLTQFFITLGRSLNGNEKTNQCNERQKIEKPMTQPPSNKSSEHEYNEKNEERELGQLKCQFYWSRKMESHELNFKVSVFVTKKIYPLYFNQIQNIWYKLADKWKVILDEDKQLSGFNPGFVILDYNKESNQMGFTDYIKYQPMKQVLAELLLATDKLIIATLAMKEVICFYEKKSQSTDISEEQLVLNQGRLQNLALSVSQGIKNYYFYCKKVMNSKDETKKPNENCLQSKK